MAADRDRDARRAAGQVAAAALALVLFLAGCSHSEDDQDVAKPTTSTTIGTTIPLGPPPKTCGPTVTAEVERMAAGTRVVSVQNVAVMLPASGPGVSGCLFRLAKGPKDDPVGQDVTVLVQPQAQSYFDQMVASQPGFERLPSLGDEAFVVGEKGPGGRTWIIGRRGSKIVEVRSTNSRILDRKALVALATDALGQ